MDRPDPMLSLLAAGGHLPDPATIKQVSVGDLQKNKAGALLARIYADFKEQTLVHTFTGPGLLRAIKKTIKRVRLEVAPISPELAQEAIGKFQEMIRRAKETEVK